tara:strand:+ start:31 stop:240 length:210 start_codon:yes stop_codon:yes gene_type:complete
MKFKNKYTHDVYVDMGNLVRVAPGEVIELEGTSSCPPLTPVFETTSVPKKAPKKKASKSKKIKPTSGTI